MSIEGYVYVLTHLNTGKKYVGRSKDPKTRCLQHMNSLIKGTHPNKAMQKDFDQYAGDYKLEVVEIEPQRFQDAQNTNEKKWMKKLKTYDERYGYNDQDPAMISVRLENGLPAYKFFGRYKEHKRKWVSP
jgi:predicted GIY-YIG superfamily endonuclease